MTIHLKLSLELSLPEHDADAFLVEYRGDIIKSETGAVVGRVCAFALAAEACREYGYSPIDALDSRQATAPYMKIFSMTEAGNFTPSVLRALGMSNDEIVFSQNMLIIDRVEILPRYRGHDYGLQAMHMLLAQLSTGCRLAAIKPFPLQFEHKRGWDTGMELGALSTNKKEAGEKLREHYGRLGFKPVGRTLMILDLAAPYSTAWPAIKRHR